MFVDYYIYNYNILGKFGKIWLFFGCRQKELDLYRDEKLQMLKLGVLDRIFLALSRKKKIKKVNFIRHNYYYSDV